MQQPTKKLNVAMVCDPIGSNKSGVVVSTMRFGKMLKERGHHVIFVGARSKEHRDHSYHEGIRTYRYRSIPVPRSGGWNLAFPTTGELKKVFKDEKIDVVHILLPMSGAIVATLAARSLGIRIVAHSHSQPENIFLDMPRIIQPMLGNLWNRYLSWIYGKAEYLIYPTEMARSLLQDLSRKNQPSEVVSNGINLKEFRPKSDLGDFNAKFGIPEKSVKLLFVGRLFPEKSVETLIKATPHILKGHSNTHVMLAGAGHQRPKLEKLSRVLGVSDNITFLGLISEEDKILAYNACDIFVLPSLAELEGMVVLEAMACGKPIIVSDSQMSASRYFVDGNGLLFKALDHQDLAHQVLKMIHGEEMRQRFGEASFQKSKNYDIERSVDLLEKIYSGGIIK